MNVKPALRSDRAVDGGSCEARQEVLKFESVQWRSDVGVASLSKDARMGRRCPTRLTFLARIS